jgi:D-ribose pyranase
LNEEQLLMKKSGILHPDLCHLLASTGHTDHITICDRGFPVPDGPRRIDLALVDNIPTVLDVLGAVHAEFALDRVIITHEMTEVSPDRVQALRDLLGDIPLAVMPHLEFKHLAATAKATVRTGDATPYANIIIVSG